MNEQDKKVRFEEIKAFIERHAANQAESQTYIVALKSITGVR